MDALKCEAFLTAVARGSMTAAARELGYTQSGITRMVASLEAEVGFDLLVRGKRGVEPTANGRAMMPAFREVVRADRVAQETGTQIRGVLSGVLVIGSYFSVAAIWMPQVLKVFCGQHPGVRVEMREGGNRDMARWLGERSVDCCFCAEPAPGVECDWLPVREDDLLAWLPTDHPKANLPAFPLADLATEPFIITSPGQDTDIDRLMAAEGIDPNVRFSTADAFTTYCMVEQGLGMSLNNRLITSRWTGGVVTIPLDPPRSVSLGLAVPSLAAASPATRRFIDCVGEVLGS